ncbi:MAG: CcoQ/FixQ family Cbb3-type cytochrome c oxidase assembly chaperone [Bdellovibrionales bacterium]|jgi:cbb3-type cytochrome oxidase subunit 3|nr:CcoQ/FixQ family Cbb3-type cytochrome c oxidase assembly chaperone [Bdellovibrionales bacterium]MBT3526516.1 CcoQ/FixQ family Cbb3-type cytochrome c oxidase assembly chaperone [Bdellovibrionales bacterium]MBT7766392.1 CcoQ/FixQ family Cbb3-type cytochrome c oxidase assembly chaperone [Bdellovibrionales bacterium]
MKQLVLGQMDMPWLPITGLLIFLAFFIAVLLWSYRKSSNEIYQQAAQLPLNEAEVRGVDYE